MTDLTYRDAVAALFKSRPGEWIDGMELARYGGIYGWRTRVSEARRDLAMTIENDVRQVPGSKRKVSLYRYVPSTLLEIAS
jgi:predicted transcriptional regulator